MTYTTTMTQKGQVTIPKSIRDLLRVGRNTKFLVGMDNQTGEVRLKPLGDLMDFEGALKSNISFTDEQLRQARVAFAKQWGSRGV